MKILKVRCFCLSDLQKDSIRPIEIPAAEIDEPLYPMQRGQIPLKEQQEWVKWIKDFNFIKFTLGLMVLLYIIYLIISVAVFQKNSSLTEPLFEVLKTVLLTVAGYVFGKSQEVK